MKKYAIVLSGCGVFDGAEIHEATLTMLAVKRQNCDYEIFAPDMSQHHVINHITGEEMDETRNVLIESARIARGNIKALNELNQSDFDGIIFPGGFGAAKNLSDLAFKGAECTVEPSVSQTIKSFHEANKPIGALCISPAVISKVLGNIEVTIGSDEGTIAAIESFGSKHTNTKHTEVVVDKENKIVTTPCYMLDANIAQIADGAENLVKELINL